MGFKKLSSASAPATFRLHIWEKLLQAIISELDIGSTRTVPMATPVAGSVDPWADLDCKNLTLLALESTKVSDAGLALFNYDARPDSRHTNEM